MSALSEELYVPGTSGREPVSCQPDMLGHLLFLLLGLQERRLMTQSLNLSEFCLWNGSSMGRSMESHAGVAFQVCTSCQDRQNIIFLPEARGSNAKDCSP